MEHLAKPPSGAEIVPLSQPVDFKGERLRGTAVALSTDGTTMYYLIVPDKSRRRYGRLSTILRHLG